MIFMTILFAVVFLMYNWLMHETVGKLWSVSEGYYKLEEKNTGSGRIFTLFLLCIAAYLFGLTVFTENIIFAIGIAGAIITGVAANYMDGKTKIIHYGGSAVMIGSTATGCWMSFDNWWVVVGIAVSALIVFGLYKIKKIDNPVYWGEQAAFAWIVLGVVIN